MASYHLSVKTVQRSAGRSTTTAAAYRHAERIACHREGRVHDYRAKQGVEMSLLVLPDHAPAWAEDRASLWNAAEARETRVNSVTAREWELALPHELNASGRRALVEGFARELVARYGVAADVAIHAPHREGDQRNWHAHVLTTTRALTQDGLTDKTRVLDAKQTGGPEVEHMRARWGELQNQALEQHGHKERVDHRTLAVQRDEARALGHEAQADNLDRPPEVKLGPAVSAVERREQRQAEQDRHEYVPVTERGAQVHEARAARSLLQEIAQLRERLHEAVQAQLRELHERAELAHEAYSHAREEGAHKVRAGLAALRAAAQKQGIGHDLKHGQERGSAHGQAAGDEHERDLWQERQASRASIKDRLGRILAREASQDCHTHHAQDGAAVGLSAHGLDGQHRQGQERSLGTDAIREQLEALRDRVRPVAQDEELAAGLPAHGRSSGRSQEAHQAQAHRLDAIRERLRDVLDRAKPVALEEDELGHERGPEHRHEGRVHQARAHQARMHTERVHGHEREDPLARVVERLRGEAADAPSFASERQARAFQAEMERRFDPGTLQRLGQGHEATLAQITDDRLDGLCLARAWLDSGGKPPRSEARMSLWMPSSTRRSTPSARGSPTRGTGTTGGCETSRVGKPGRANEQTPS